MSRVRYQGRLVSKTWYNRFVAKKIAVRAEPTDRTILAKIYLPAIRATREPAEERLVNLNNPRERRWVQDIGECYAMPPATELTSFFAP